MLISKENTNVQNRLKKVASLTNQSQVACQSDLVQGAQLAMNLLEKGKDGSHLLMDRFVMLWACRQEFFLRLHVF